jgi:hypothetical protein
MNPSFEKLLLPSECASILRVSISSLAVWRCVGRYPELKFIKVGRSVRYSADAISKFIAARSK